MINFSLKEYENTNKNTKIKVFIQYLYEKYCSVEGIKEFDNIYFSLFTDVELLESLEYYIDKNRVTAQVTASNYITYVAEFFKMLSDKYNIKNDTFSDIALYNQLILKSKIIISKLKESEGRDMATDEQYEMLNEGISEFLSKYTTEDYYIEIDNVKEGSIKNIKIYVKIYNRFVSIISTKLIMKFALGNLATISMDFKDLDINNSRISINGFKLPLDKELNELFKTYLEVRKYILSLYSIQESKLFIKINGEPYIQYNKKRPDSVTTDYSSFFMIMGDILKTKSGELIASRRILEMFDKGIDVDTISKLSSRSINKCIELQSRNNDENVINKKLQILFKEDEIAGKRIISDKTFKNENRSTKCPFCGREAKAISDEWILVQFEGKDTKYLSCKKCRGTK